MVLDQQATPCNKVWSLEGSSSVGCFLHINVFMFLYSVSTSMQQSLEFGGQQQRWMFLHINVFMFLYSVSASMQHSLEFGGQY